MTGIQLFSRLKADSKYDVGTSIASQVSVWRWSWLKFSLSVTSPALVSIQPIRLSKNLTSGIKFDYWKNTLLLCFVMLMMLTLPASYCEPAFSLTRLAVTILNLSLSKKQFHCFCLLVIENENRVVECALRCRRGKKAQKNERIATEYAQMSTKCAQICLHF